MTHIISHAALQGHQEEFGNSASCCWHEYVWTGKTYLHADAVFGLRLALLLSMALILLILQLLVPCACLQRAYQTPSIQLPAPQIDSHATVPGVDIIFQQ